MTVSDEALFLVAGLDLMHGGCSTSLHVMDITAVASPRYTAEFDPQSCVNDIAVDGDTLVVATTSGLQIFDASDPANPILASEWAHPSGLNGVQTIAVNQDIAYTTTEAGLRILDLTQPAAPILTGDALDLAPGLGSCVSALYVRGSKLFAQIDASLITMDISQPASPRLIPNYVAGRSWTAPVLVGNALYTATAAGLAEGLGIFDMSTPANPVLSNTIYITGYWVHKMVASHRYLVVLSQKRSATTASGTTLSKRFQIYDVSDPFRPVELGQIAVPEAVYDFAVVGDSLYYVRDVDNNFRELYVVGISDPAHPAEVGRFALPFDGIVSVSAGDTLYLESWATVEFWALNVSDPAHPYLAGHLQLPGSVSSVSCISGVSSSVSVAGDLLYTAAGDAGLFITSVSRIGDNGN